MLKFLVIERGRNMDIIYMKWVLLSTLFFLASGCGDGKIGVSGSISYEGIAPEKGTIAFIADNGAGTTYGGPYTNGRYSVRVPEGTYLVRIAGWNIVALDEPIVSDMGRPTITTREDKIVPDEYGHRSKMQIEITKSARTQDFTLEKPTTDLKPQP